MMLTFPVLKRIRGGSDCMTVLHKKYSNAVFEDLLYLFNDRVSYTILAYLTPM
jgi:hypothetical protein